MKKAKLSMITLFAGIGCQERGFENSGVFDIEVVATSEVDKDAIVMYAAMHNGLTPKMLEEYSGYPSMDEMVQELAEKNIGDYKKKNPARWLKTAGEAEIRKCWLACQLNHNLGDICRIEELPYADLWTGSFPCQDISGLGKQRGLKRNSGTRSSLVWKQIDLLEKAVADGIAPKFLLFENTANLLKKFKGDFDGLCDVLSGLGYNSYAQILDAQDCGIPQSRKRAFAICIRKDIDTGRFQFPKPYKCEISLEDMLDKEPGEQAFIKDEGMESFLGSLVEEGLLPDPNSGDVIDDIRNGNWHGTAGRDSAGRNLKAKGKVTNGKESFVLRNFREFVEKMGYVPAIFVAKSQTHVKNHVARCLLTSCGSPSGANSMLILDTREADSGDGTHTDIKTGARHGLGRRAISRIGRLIRNGIITKDGR